MIRILPPGFGLIPLPPNYKGNDYVFFGPLNVVTLRGQGFRKGQPRATFFNETFPYGSNFSRTIDNVTYSFNSITDLIPFKHFLSALPFDSLTLDLAVSYVEY